VVSFAFTVSQKKLTVNEKDLILQKKNAHVINVSFLKGIRFRF
jgi:hypothetical protein